MKRICIALAAGLVALVVAPVSAEDTAPAPKPVAPTVVSATPVEVVSGTPTTTRRGLLARLRDRRTGTSTMTVPVSSGTIVTPATPAATPAPMTAPIPAPLPSKPTTSVVPASGTMPTSPMVMTAGYVSTSDTTTPTARRGLMARLRARR